MEDIEDEDAPRSVARTIASMIMGSSSSSSSSYDQYMHPSSNEESDSTSSSSSSDKHIDDAEEKKPKAYVPRRRFKKRDQYQSNWWNRYLATEEIRSTLTSDCTHRDTKEFKGLFRVDYVILLQAN